MTKTRFILQILHGGKLVQGEQITYVNGEEYICTVNSDFMSYFELMDIMKDIGYPNHPILYYRLPNSNMNTGLVKLSSDAKIVHMFDVHAKSDIFVIEVFVHTPDLVDVFCNSDSDSHDNVQIDSDKEAFSGMEESSTDNEEETDYDKIMPPHIRKRAGMPKKNRKKADDEPNNPIRVKKHYTSLRCDKCKEVGHNSRTCQKIPHEGKQPNQTSGSGSKQ
ncbi:hypothetical protein Acr_17g0002230 [Actinidia rufa]|uniref:PB1-like domain-containing protein n=1 Tax=Actinidia rufa TaxID=165716 RepID=A0A7J0G1J2_9ERIC|nr:hypothetical protein Acr_17g0002230 [Actinidia rufa]